MKNNWSRFGVGLLCLMLLLGLMGVPMEAGAAVVDSGTCGDNLTWVFDDATGTLTISGTGEMKLKNYMTEDGSMSPWYAVKEEITKVIIEEGVTDIGVMAFYYYPNLKEAVLPSTLDSIDQQAFAGSGLERIEIPDGVTYLGISAFGECPDLTYAKLPANLEDSGYSVFSGCPNLEYVDMSAVSEDYGCYYMFAESDGFVDLDFYTLNNISESMFLGCNGFEVLAIPEGVTEVEGQAFGDCANLTEVTFPSTLTKLGAMIFHGCDKLNTIRFLGDAPSGSLPIPLGEISATCYYPAGNETWTEEAKKALGGDLTWVAYNPNSGTCGDNLTWTLDSNGTLTISGTGPMEYDSQANFAPWHEMSDQITAVSIENGVTSIGDEAFYHCDNLTSITIPDSVTSIGAYAFFSCDSLTSITIPDSVTSIGEGALSACGSLTSITIPDSVTSIGDYAFHYCHSLTSITIPDSLTSIADGAFSGCSLTSITIPDSVTSIGGAAFAECPSLTSVTIPVGVTSIGAGAFSYCTSLTSITIPAGVTSIGEWSFGRCYALTEVTFQGDAPAIEYDAFDSVTANVYYPATNDTWTEDKLQDYFGTLTWIPVGEAHTHTWDKGTVTTAATCTDQGVKTYTCECGETKTEPIPVTAHTEVTDAAVEATCTETGLTEGKHCSVCNAVTVKQETVPAKGHSFADGSCKACGEKDSDWTEPTEPEETEPTEPGETEPNRVAGANRFDTAFVVADQMKANLGVEKFDAVVVASGTNFADALSGSYLSAAKNAPILLSFTTDAINNDVKDYIRENLNEGGTVYILGGESAVPASMETGLDGFTVKRLAGGNRFETNLMILEEAGVGDKPVLVCTGLSFADSLSASAAKLPILLVWNDLTEGQKNLLEGLNGNKLYIIGGESAVGKGMEEQLTAYGEVERVAGGNRFETSVAIAETFFDAPKSAVLAYAWNFPDGLCGGPLAATMDAPLILTMDNYEAKAAEYIQTRNVQNGIILGGEGLISQETVNTIFN